MSFDVAEGLEHYLSNDNSLLISDELSGIHRNGLAIYIFEYLIISK